MTLDSKRATELGRKSGEVRRAKSKARKAAKAEKKRADKLRRGRMDVVAGFLSECCRIPT
jgi:hypothetical protein